MRYLKTLPIVLLSLTCLFYFLNGAKEQKILPFDFSEMDQVIFETQQLLAMLDSEDIAFINQDNPQSQYGQLETIEFMTTGPVCGLQDYEKLKKYYSFSEIEANLFNAILLLSALDDEYRGNQTLRLQEWIEKHSLEGFEHLKKVISLPKKKFSFETIEKVVKKLETKMFDHGVAEPRAYALEMLKRVPNCVGLMNGFALSEMIKQDKTILNGKEFVRECLKLLANFNKKPSSEILIEEFENLGADEDMASVYFDGWYIHFRIEEEPKGFLRVFSAGPDSKDHTEDDVFIDAIPI